MSTSIHLQEGKLIEYATEKDLHPPYGEGQLKRVIERLKSEPFKEKVMKSKILRPLIYPDSED